MKKSLVWLLFLAILTISSTTTGRQIQERHRHHHHRHHHHHRRGGSVYSERNKLFVFGDSYVDTGNWDKATGSSWKPPYGITFPGIPAGRFSDGRILTDFLAEYLEIRSPIPYVRRNMLPNAKVEFGMNFAYGGTGVFDTYISKPNMTSQINLFNDVITREKVYNISDIRSSVALVSLAGNDYATFLLREPSPKPELNQELIEFINSIVRELELNLKQIGELGVGKVAVTTLPPLGCLPMWTSLVGYNSCHQMFNEAANFHNRLLLQSVNRLNKDNPKQAFFVLDLYHAILSAVQGQQTDQSGKQLENGNSLLEQCCRGVNSSYDCGNVEGNEAKYRVCSNPQAAFFWDTVHLTQHGWHQVYLSLQHSLKALVS